jgi:hypothetical protein
VNRIANTRRELPLLSDEERLRLALAKIERVHAELRLDQALGEIERAADDLRKIAGARGSGPHFLDCSTAFHSTVRHESESLYTADSVLQLFRNL